MKFKSCPAFKVADSATDAGTFEAIVSVFGNVDAAGDVVLPGAFTKSLADWEESGDPIPVLWSHRMDDPRFSIGSLLDAAELEPYDERIPEWADEWLKANGGLWVKGKIDVGNDATDVASAAHKLLKGRLVKQFSYAYDIVEGGWGKAQDREAFELRTLDIYEVSPTQIGCNNLTQLLGAKAASLVVAGPDLVADPSKARRAITDMSSEDICEAIGYLSKVLASRNTVDGTDASDGGTVKDEEPRKAKSEEPKRHDDTRSIRLLSQLLETELEYAS